MFWVLFNQRVLKKPKIWNINGIKIILIFKYIELIKIPSIFTHFLN